MLVVWRRRQVKITRFWNWRKLCVHINQPEFSARIEYNLSNLVWAVLILYRAHTAIFLSNDLSYAHIVLGTCPQQICFEITDISNQSRRRRQSGEFLEFSTLLLLSFNSNESCFTSSLFALMWRAHEQHITYHTCMDMVHGTSDCARSIKRVPREACIPYAYRWYITTHNKRRLLGRVPRTWLRVEMKWPDGIEFGQYTYE